ncbi:MAG: 50S ribosomal protein L23 [Actinobacteria bacterium]|jgi:large subunit ribosomal protein L23|nr:50S ribosomal protein L23 [Actinomycetota bacterium]MCL6104670.1 50S ribosomal protein L23 [Actinomycetota bacterium]
MSKDIYQMIMRPVVSEKSYKLMEKNTYVFVVNPSANRVEIRDAVANLFGVRVTKVRVLNRKGKLRRNRKAMTFGKKPDTKRAMVTVAEGEHIDLFES